MNPDPDNTGWKRESDHLPARMVNEFVYCPRLFYLEHVDAEWAHNADTLEGRFVHRRVDKPAGAVPAAPGNQPAPGDQHAPADQHAPDIQPAAGAGDAAPIPADSAADGIPDECRVHARSVTLGSDRLGVTAVVDLLEGDGTHLTPIDYKKGRPPDVVDGVWDSDAVQVCLQGLLLRDHGYTCDSGVVYYHVTRQRIEVPFTETLVERTLAAVADARELARSARIPPPLDRSPKCPRCSLVGICLPDETNLLAESASPGLEALLADPDGAAATAPPASGLPPRDAASPSVRPRRLIAPLDDRRPLYVVEHGLTVGLDAGVLVVKKGREKVASVRLIDCSHVALFGNAQISSQALREVLSRDMIVVHMSHGGWLVGITSPPPRRNIDLRRRQFGMAESADDRVRIARAMVAGKIANSRTLLRRNSAGLSESTLRMLAALRAKARTAGSIETLLGIEGSAARVYFEGLATALRPSAEGDTAFDFDGRNRRPPRDPVNALLSFVYSLLTKDFVAATAAVGFDPYLGFLHAPRYGRPALALDLMEEFRPLVADSVVLSLVNTREVSGGDFVFRAGACALTPDGRRRVIEAYERRVNTEVTHPLFGYAVSYRRVFELQARLLARVLSGEAAEYRAFRTR